MAASTITPAQRELINSLSQDEIPIKLRCAICSRLAVNAFRLPCCDQAICESCQSTLPATCPVCEHTPVAAADCKANKSLRTTIKVFLRTEEKKREALRLKEEKNTPPDTPLVVEAVPIIPVGPNTPSEETQIASNESKDVEEGKDDVSQAPVAEEGQNITPPVDQSDIQQTDQAEQDIPQPSIEEIAPGQESTADIDTNSADEAKDGEEATGKNAAGQPVVPQTPGFSGFGFDPSAAGSFPGMGFGGDMNQMMMLAMQNGMGAGGFGNFPMMGMPGMAMDPMTMQNMFMSGGFGAGMNGMGMNMGFGGGVGTDFNNGWNAQQSWNLGNNCNPNPASMGHGDYGANNSGYASHSAGFNQGNYGRGTHYNDYQNSYVSQGFRGRGRGRGGYARGGHAYGSNEPFPHQTPQQYGSNQTANGPISESGSIPKGPKAETEGAANVDEFGRELRPEITEVSENKKETSQEVADENTIESQETKASDNTTTDAAPQESTEIVQDSTTPMPIQTLDEVENNYNSDNCGPSGYGQGHYRGGLGGSFSAMQPPVKPVDVPINAPTGPKAMREGLPNTSIYNLRGRGHIPGGISSRHEPSGSASVSIVPGVSPKGDDDQKYSRSPSRDRERDRSKDRSRSRSPHRKRSRSRDRHRRHRQRSASPTEDDKETERRRERRREKDRERRRRHDDAGILDDGPGEKIEEKADVTERSRSASPSESRRSDHKSRRDKDKYRERDRDSDRDRKSHRHRSHRSHRDDRDRSRSRDRRHSRRHSEEPQEPPVASVVVAESTPRQEEPFRKPSIIEIKGASVRRKATLDDIKTDIKIPTGPRSDRIPGSATSRESNREKHTREDRSSRHESSRSGRDKDRDRDRGYDREKFREKAKEKENNRLVPTAPAKNPHELEREARNRERLLKEAQRMAGLTGSGRKREREDGEEALVVKGRRKKGRRGGAMDESEESRITRLEAEREGNRWN